MFCFDRNGWTRTWPNNSPRWYLYRHCMVGAKNVDTSSAWESTKAIIYYCIWQKVFIFPLDYPTYLSTLISHSNLFFIFIMTCSFLIHAWCDHNCRDVHNCCNQPQLDYLIHFDLKNNFRKVWIFLSIIKILMSNDGGWMRNWKKIKSCETIYHIEHSWFQTTSTRTLQYCTLP